MNEQEKAKLVLEDCGDRVSVEITHASPYDVAVILHGAFSSVLAAGVVPRPLLRAVLDELRFRLRDTD